MAALSLDCLRLDLRRALAMSLRNLVAFAAIADLAKQFNDPDGTAPASGNRNDMVVLQPLPAAAATALALVPAPDSNAYFLGERITSDYTCKGRRALMGPMSHAVQEYLNKISLVVQDWASSSDQRSF